MAHADPKSFLDEWHRIVAKRDLVALPAVIHPDVSMGAPPYWPKFEGRDTVVALLGIIVTTIEGFSYYREWSNGKELALEFKGKVGDLELQGIDLITLNDDNEMANLDVLIRPMNALSKLQKIVQPQMMEFLKRHAAAG